MEATSWFCVPKLQKCCTGWVSETDQSPESVVRNPGNLEATSKWVPETAQVTTWLVSHTYREHGECHNYVLCPKRNVSTSRAVLRTAIGRSRKRRAYQYAKLVWYTAGEAVAAAAWFDLLFLRQPHCAHFLHCCGKVPLLSKDIAQALCRSRLQYMHFGGGQDLGRPHPATSVPLNLVLHLCSLCSASRREAAQQTSRFAAAIGVLGSRPVAAGW